MESMIKQISTDVLTNVARKASRELVYEPDSGFLESSLNNQSSFDRIRRSDTEITAPSTKISRIESEETFEAERIMAAEKRQSAIQQAKQKYSQDLAQRKSNKVLGEEPLQPASVTRLRSETLAKKSVPSKNSLEKNNDSVITPHHISRVASYLEERDETIREITRSLEILQNMDLISETSHASNITNVLSERSTVASDPKLETVSLHSVIDETNKRQSSREVVNKKTSEVARLQSSQHKNTDQPQRQIEHINDVEKLRSMKVTSPNYAKVESGVSKTKANISKTKVKSGTVASKTVDQENDGIPSIM